MKSKLCPICQSLISCKSDVEATNSIISQFVTSFEVDYQATVDLSRDEKFPYLLQHLMTTLCTNPIPPPNSSPTPEIVNEILIFFNKLMIANPIILDTIAASANLDTLTTQFFAGSISKNELIAQNSAYLLPPIKFIALVSSSKRVMLTSTPSSHQLIIVLLSLLTNAQLAAWAASTLAGLLRNSPSFLSILKVHPMYKCVKNKLTALLPSSDPCVVVAALSATVPLYSLGDDSDTAMKAAIKYIDDESVFPLSTKLCCWVIGDLIEKVRLNENSFNLLLQIPLTSTGVRAYWVINLLIELIDMHFKFGSLDYNRVFFTQTILFTENFTATAGCQYLFAIYENYPELFLGIDETGDLLKKVLKRYFYMSAFQDPERTEALLVQVRLLLMKQKLSDNIIQILINHEEAIFMDFMRHIENNDSYLSVCYFNFLLICSKYIENWVIRIKRVLVDSQFPALLVHVLTTSKNRRTISDSLGALQFFINDCEISKDYSGTFYFNSAVSGFLLMNQQTTNQVQEVQSQLNQERHDFEITLLNLKTEKCQLLCENKDLQRTISDEKMNSSQSLEKATKFQKEMKKKDEMIGKIQKKLQTFKAYIKEQNNNIKISEANNQKLIQENLSLKKYGKKMERYKTEYHKEEAENKRLKETIQDLEAKLSYTQQLLSKSQTQVEKLLPELSARDEQFSQMQKRCQECQELNQSLQLINTNKKSEIQKLNTKIISLEEELNREQGKTGDMTKTIADLQEENIKIMATINDNTCDKAKYRVKKQKMLERISQMEKDRRKWESIAKFNQHICTVKKVTVQDVFGEFTVEAPTQ